MAVRWITAAHTRSTTTAPGAHSSTPSRRRASTSRSPATVDAGHTPSPPVSNIRPHVHVSYCMWCMAVCSLTTLCGADPEGASVQPHHQHSSSSSVHDIDRSSVASSPLKHVMRRSRLSKFSDSDLEDAAVRHHHDPDDPGALFRRQKDVSITISNSSDRLVSVVVCVRHVAFYGSLYVHSHLCSFRAVTLGTL